LQQVLYGGFVLIRAFDCHLPAFHRLLPGDSCQAIAGCPKGRRPDTRFAAVSAGLTVSMAGACRVTSPGTARTARTCKI
jgi:hypothetical protein